MNAKACESQTFSGIDEPTWNRLVAKAVEAKLPVSSGHSGRASQDGFTVRWQYSSSAQTLEIQCLESPWWAPCPMIQAKIAELVKMSL